MPLRNPSNTCLRPLGQDKLLSLYEGGLPFELDANSLETLGGENNLGGAVRGSRLPDPQLNLESLNCQSSNP